MTNPNPEVIGKPSVLALVTAWSPFFLSQRRGRWRWPWIPAGLLGSFLALSLSGLVLLFALELFAPEIGDLLSSEEFLSSEELSTRPQSLLAELLFIGGTFWVAAIGGTLVHGRSVRSLVAPAQAFRWKVVAKTLGLLALAQIAVSVLAEVGAAVGLAADVSPGITFTGLRPAHAVWIVPLLLATLIQTSGEDVFFKGLLLRQLGAVTRIFWIAPALVTLGFVSLHIGNPDLEQNFWILILAFAASEFVIIGLMMRTGGMEIPLVMHWVNNAVIFLLIGEEGTQANELTLFVTEQLEDSQALSAEVWGIVWFGLLNLIVATGVLWERSPFHVERFTGPPPPRPQVPTASLPNAGAHNY